MSSRPQRRNRRQDQFRVIAHGVRHPQPNISRLAQVSLELYLAEKERDAQTGSTRTKSVEESSDEPR